MPIEPPRPNRRIARAAAAAPAMTLFDVDGSAPPEPHTLAAARAVCQAVERHGIAGSIGIDFPTLANKAARLAVAAAIDAALPQPFERTGVNGFGFLQIVRRRERASIPEIVQGDPAGAAARALLRRAQRASGHGPLTLQAAPAVIARLEAEPVWLEALRRQAGAEVVLQPDAALAISGTHVQRGSP